MNKILFLIFFEILFLLNVNFNSEIVFSQNSNTIVYVKDRSFSIPFQIRNDNMIDKIEEVELLVSKDYGVRWYSVGRKPIDARFFLFETDTDGEYWFSFRTITASGMVKRSLNNSPQIRVRVDTSILNATQNVNGSIDSAQKIRHSKNQNVTNTISNSPKQIIEGAIQPPKPITFYKEQEKKIAQSNNKNKINVTNNQSTPNEIKTEQLNLSFNEKNNLKNNDEQKDQNDQNDQNDQKSLFTELPFPILPDEKLIMVGSKNDDLKSDINEKNNEPNKISKTERKALILKRLFDDFAALFKEYNETENEVNTINTINQSNNRNSNNDVVANGNSTTNSITNSVNSVTVANLSEEPSAVTVENAGKIARNYESVNVKHDSDNIQNQNQIQNQNRQESINHKSGKVRIAAVTMNVATEQHQIIVKWDSSDLSATGNLADILRGESSTGPWQPIAIGLPNNGEYWWYFSPEDKKPFYLMIRTRNAIDIIGEDITQAPITVK
ncbi:MAG: hypothetical protein LBE18_06400 [Planctomycetaceae bacterium]|jgi:hypothetical protein|nr:hypothetical protein [Planctomycetaceae bacterium]